MPDLFTCNFPILIQLINFDTKHSISTVQIDADERTGLLKLRRLFPQLPSLESMSFGAY